MRRGRNDSVESTKRALMMINPNVDVLSLERASSSRNKKDIKKEEEETIYLFVQSVSRDSNDFHPV